MFSRENTILNKITGNTPKSKGVLLCAPEGYITDNAKYLCFG